MDQDKTTIERKTTIDDLPEEILLIIFKLLDQESLQQASLTCEMWRSLSVGGISWKMIIESLNELRFALRNFPNLKTVVMAGFSHQELFFPLETSELSKIKNLQLHSYCTETLRLLDKTQLETLLIAEDFVNSVCLCYQVDIVSFLAGQTNLTTLQLISADGAWRMPISAENVPFKLKELSLTGFNMLDNGYGDILTFMKLHEDTLETLQLGHFFPTPIYELAFAKLKKLKKLCLKIDGLKICESCIEHLEVNRSVTTLKLYEHWRQCTSYEVTQIIRHLPNIENLVLSVLQPYDKLSAVLPDLKQLKHLTIQTFDRQFWQNVTFPKLESLRFVNAKLENGSDIAFVAKNLNLRSLVFDGNVDSDFLDAISGNFPKLVSLDLRKSIVNAGITSHIRGLRLRDEDFFGKCEIYGDFFGLEFKILHEWDSFSFYNDEDLQDFQL